MNASTEPKRPAHWWKKGDIISPETQFKKGEHHSRNTEFKKGQHWRPRKPWWNKPFMENLYLEKKMSYPAIAKMLNVSKGCIHHWLLKHGIQVRDLSQARAVQFWRSGPGGFARRGEAHHAWRGGITPFRQKIYASKQWETTARKVRKRDGHRCRWCNKERGETDLHHIQPVAKARHRITDVNNIITLCTKCPAKTFQKEEKFEHLFNSIIGVRKL